MLSDLPKDLAEDVLLRLPLKSMGAVRLACKNWNLLSKSRSFRKRHLGAIIKAGSEFLVVMVMESGYNLISVNLNGIQKGLEPSINDQGKLLNLTGNSDGVNLFRACHCDGLLLCIPRSYTRLIVWNPYLSQTRLLKPVICEPHSYIYAIGYDQNSSSSSSSSSCGRNYKILRYYETSREHTRYEVYYLNQSRNDDTSPITILSDWGIECYARGASVKGNTYWFAQEKIPPEVEEIEEVDDFLICFDFTREQFGTRLPLPFHSYAEDLVSLYSVRDEQLAVLYQPENTLPLEIWITNRIEPNAVSWNSKVFLAADMNPLTGFQFPCDTGEFFVDEEKKIAVVFYRSKNTMGRYSAYVIGEDGYFKEIDFADAARSRYPLIIPYVPSLAQITPEEGNY